LALFEIGVTTHGHNRSGVVVGEIQSLADLAAVNSQEQRPGLDAGVGGRGRLAYGAVILGHQLFQLVSPPRFTHDHLDPVQLSQQPGDLPSRVQFLHQQVRRHEAQHAVRHVLTHVLQHLSHLVLETVRVGVLVLAVQVDPGRSAVHRRHPTLAMLDHVVGLQRDRELGAEFGLERLHRRQRARREDYVAGRRLQFVEHGRRVQAQEADDGVPHRTRVVGLVAAVQPSVHRVRSL